MKHKTKNGLKSVRLRKTGEGSLPITDLGSQVSSFVVEFGAVLPLLFAYPVPLFGVEVAAPLVATVPAATVVDEDDAAPTPLLPLDALGIFDTTVDPYTRIASSFSSSNASCMENRGCFIFGIDLCVSE